MVTIETIPFSREKSLENTIWFGPSRMTFLATGEDTAGQFAVIESEARRGIEPPRHVHEREDECFYLFEGEIDFKVGALEFHVSPGGLVFMPRGVPHEFHLCTETAKTLVTITPAGFEGFFRKLGKPATSFDVPAFEPPTAERVQQFVAVGREFGVSFV
jgi:quercetin dioxygenase-like cupin family protein